MRNLILFVLACSFANPLWADLRQDLKDFFDNPKDYMKRDVKTPTNERFNYHLKIRDQIKSHSLESASHDRPEDVVDPQITVVKNIVTMDQMGLTSASLAVQPWSDSYWPVYRGILGNRYEDRGFNRVGNRWLDLLRYVSDPGSRLSDFARNDVDDLSPSEKYDLLLESTPSLNVGSYGTVEGLLTHKMWNEGRQYYDRFGTIETWMGICHGWAIASYMLPEPQKPVTLRSSSQQITFYPSDIKALGSYLWANGQHSNRFVGGRCQSKDPATDRNGRILDEDCFDVNPATWHMIVTNQVGVARKSMVIDITYDYEVWNQPVYSYSYQYFNPYTQDITSNLQDATVSAQTFFSRDKFAKYRNNNAKYLVGIAMDLVYISEAEPTHSGNHNSPVRVRYLYDLELDENKNIIGGEWYNNRHPDFIWTSAVPHAYSVADTTFTSPAINSDGSVAPAQKSAAIRASQSSQVLGNLVEEIFRLSH